MWKLTSAFFEFVFNWSAAIAIHIWIITTYDKLTQAPTLLVEVKNEITNDFPNLWFLNGTQLIHHLITRTPHLGISATSSLLKWFFNIFVDNLWTIIVFIQIKSIPLFALSEVNGLNFHHCVPWGINTNFSCLMRHCVITCCISKPIWLRMWVMNEWSYSRCQY